MAELAFDIGQTQSRLRLIADDGRATDLELDGFRYGDEVISVVLQRCREAADRFGIPSITAVAGGVTGLYGIVPDISELAAQLATTLGVQRVVVADDAVSSHLGALNGEPGALVAAGTGIVGLGIGPRGAARVDGVGSLIGDDGSGWWIGRRGVIAALSAHDGRSGGSPQLLRSLERQYGPIAGFPALVASSPFPVGTVASFAPAVAAAAREGDLEAGAIWAEAARYIGDAVVAAAIRAGFSRDARFPWAVAGRLTGASDLLDPAVESLVSAYFPASFRVNSGGSSLDGAERLLRHPDPRTLAPLVGTSTKDRERSEEEDIDD